MLLKYNFRSNFCLDKPIFLNIQKGKICHENELKPLPLNKAIYEIIHNLDTSAAILNLFSTNLDVKLELLVDEQQNYLSEFNQKVFSNSSIFFRV